MTTPKLADVEKVTELVVEDVPEDDEELNIEALNVGVAVTENVAIGDAVGKNELDASAEVVKTLVMVTVLETVEEADAQTLAVDEGIVEVDTDGHDDTVIVPRDDPDEVEVTVRIEDRVRDALVHCVTVDEEDAVIQLDADLHPDAVGLGDDVKPIELLKKVADTDAEGKLVFVPLIVAETVTLAELLDDNEIEVVILLVNVLNKKDAEILDETDTEEVADGDCD